MKRKKGYKHQAIEKAKTLIAGHPVISDAHSDDVGVTSKGKERAMQAKLPEGGTFEVLSPSNTFTAMKG